MSSSQDSNWKTRLVEGGFPDRSFDIEFWQAQGDEAIFAAAWEMVELAEDVRYGRTPTFTLTATDLKRLIGCATVQIDIHTEITGVEFSAAWKKRVSRTIFAVPVPFISLDHLIANKQATGRSSDLEQLKHLSKKAESGKQD